jgi:hypothetical protein
MNTMGRFNVLSFFLITIFLLAACGGTFQQWVASNDNFNHSADERPNYHNHDDQGESGGNNGSGGD